MKNLSRLRVCFKNGKRVFFPSLLIFFPGSFAWAIDFSLLGSLTASFDSISPAPLSFNSGFGGGGGVTAGFDMTPFTSLETGLLFTSHSFSFVSGAGSQSVVSRFAQIPVWIRVSPISFFSLNFGPYLSIPTYSSPGPSGWDYGVQLGASLRFELLPSIKWRTDVLYEFGLSNLLIGTMTTQNTRDILILTGFMVEIF